MRVVYGFEDRNTISFVFNALEKFQLLEQRSSPSRERSIEAIGSVAARTTKAIQWPHTLTYSLSFFDFYL